MLWGGWQLSGKFSPSQGTTIRDAWGTITEYHPCCVIHKKAIFRCCRSVAVFSRKVHLRSLTWDFCDYYLRRRKIGAQVNPSMWAWVNFSWLNYLLYFPIPSTSDVVSHPWSISKWLHWLGTDFAYFILIRIFFYLKKSCAYVALWCSCLLITLMPVRHRLWKS